MVGDCLLVHFYEPNLNLPPYLVAADTEMTQVNVHTNNKLQVVTIQRPHLNSDDNLSATVTLNKLDFVFQEYPYHLIKLKDTKRLQTLLCDFKVIDRLYDVDFSDKLLKYWKTVGSLYTNQLKVNIIIKVCKC